MKPTKGQEEMSKLFDKHIEQGLTIRATRQSGKTTFVIGKALELAKKGKVVAIFTFNEDQKEMLKRTLRNYAQQEGYEELLLANITIFNNQNMSDSHTWKRLNCDYTINDEPWLTENQVVQKPNVLHIGTDNTNTFTILDHSLVQPMDVNERILMGGREAYRKDFVGNVIDLIEED